MILRARHLFNQEFTELHTPGKEKAVRAFSLLRSRQASRQAGEQTGRRASRQALRGRDCVESFTAAASRYWRSEKGTRARASGQPRSFVPAGSTSWLTRRCHWKRLFPKRGWFETFLLVGNVSWSYFCRERSLETFFVGW